MIAGRPVALVVATWATVGAVAMTAVTAAMTVLFHDELVAAWSRGRTDISAVEPPAFTPVAITMSVVLIVLAGVLLSFFRHGYDWARVVLSVMVVLIGIATCAVLRTDPPVLFLAVAVVSILVDVAAAAALWHHDTRSATRLPPTRD